MFPKELPVMFILLLKNSYRDYFQHFKKIIAL